MLAKEAQGHEEGTTLSQALGRRSDALSCEDAGRAGRWAAYLGAGHAAGAIHDLVSLLSGAVVVSDLEASVDLFDLGNVGVELEIDTLLLVLGHKVLAHVLPHMITVFRVGTARGIHKEPGR